MLDAKQRMEEISAHGGPLRTINDLSYGELLHSLSRHILVLAQKEAQLVRTEIQDELDSEMVMTRRIIIAAGMIMLGFGLLLGALVFAAAPFIPPWASALIIGLLLVAFGSSTLVLVWRRHKTLAQIETELRGSLLWSTKKAK